MLLQGSGAHGWGVLKPGSKMELPTTDTCPVPSPSPFLPPYPGLLRTSAPLFFLSGQLGINWEGGATEGRGLEGRSHWDYKLRKRLLNSQSCIPENLLSAAGGCEHIEDPTMKHLLFFTLSALLCCWVSADTRCHYCYKVPVVGCVDRQSCRLDPGQKCQTTNVYLGKMWVFSNLRCGTPEEPCLEAFNQTNHKLGLVYNTTCCDKDNCNSPAPRPTPALALISLTSLAGLGLWLLH